MTRPIIAAALIIIATATAAADIHRCQSPGGRIIYTDTPCQAGWTNNVLRRQNKPAPITSNAQNILPPPPKLQRTGDPITDLNMAAAHIAVVKESGLDCKIALQVDDKHLETCIRFMSSLGPGGEIEQAQAITLPIIRNQSVITQHRQVIRSITTDLNTIAQYKEYIFAKLGVSPR